MVFRRSEEAKANFRNSMQARIDRIQDNILNLELQLLDSRNWFARHGIKGNLSVRRAQLALYLQRWDRYEREGWI
jgi:hypothetical protein